MSGTSQPPPNPSQTMLPENIPGPPYLPAVAGVGGQPTVSVDVPISAVFIVIFLISAASHMTIFKRNMARGHKFIPSGASFGFSMARIVANILRIVWATRPTNIRIAIAAQIFIAAGVLILFILNLLFAQRMLRASHPHVGWSRPVAFFFKGLYALIGLTLVAVITATVQSFYTLDTNTRLIDRNLQLYGASYMTFFAFLPLPILAYVLLAPRRGPIQEFGTGSWLSKALIVGVSAALLTLGAGFRLGTSAMPMRSPDNPAWYHHKACFYIFNFFLEALVVYTFLLGRIDRRFYVPDGSSKVRSFSKTISESGSETDSEAIKDERAVERAVEKDTP